MWLYGYVAMWRLKSQIFKISKFQKFKKLGAYMFRFVGNFESHIFIDNISPGCARFFLDLFEVSWYNEMRKFGVPGFQKSRNVDFLMFNMMESGFY